MDTIELRSDTPYPSVSCLVVLRLLLVSCLMSRVKLRNGDAITQHKSG